MVDNFDRVSYRPVLVTSPEESRPGTTVIDTVPDQLEELFLLRHPRYRFQKDYRHDFFSWRKKFLGNDGRARVGRWVYYPWLNHLVQALAEPLQQEVRTGRNRYLITEDEQKKFYTARIGILGLSVGSHAALTITMTGGGKCLKLADPDAISGSNLNRIRSPLAAVGLNKAVAVARQIVEINPYAKPTVLTRGLTEKNLESFLLRPRLDLLIEEMDNVVLKIRVREAARRHRIPVIMASDNGDNIVVDVERYDREPHYPVFHGLLGTMTAAEVAKLPPQDFPKLVGKLAAGKFNTLRMLQSVLAVGKTIYSWPQLGNAATLCGAALTYLARKIIIGEKVKTGRSEINVDRFLGVLPKQYDRQRSQLLKKLFS